MSKLTNKKAKAKVDDNSIQVFPAKRFFVDSLTRDIDLADAILDLLDNCVDGARRLGLKQEGKPYAGRRAEINYSTTEFVIKDNCGGISLSDAKDNAFKFGRSADQAAIADGTIGVIGIGMKRAIFKIGRESIVHSFHPQDSFEVRIDPEWLKNDNWTLYFSRVAPALPTNGTRISITSLNESVVAEFGSELFKKKLWEKVSAAFALLIARGFEVIINGDTVVSQIPALLWQDQSEKGASVIQPYVFRDTVDSVEVYIVVGFREADRQSDNDDEAKSYYQTAPAGWTVACNDRVVLYCDKSEQTGWGTRQAPEYHTQFIRISGFAEFKCSDPTKLPFTTTKNGINQQSKVFLKVFDRMRDGLKIFTDWTNQYKNFGAQRRNLFNKAQARSVGVEEIKTLANNQARKGSNTASKMQIIKPSLPKPKRSEKEQTVVFRRPSAEIFAVSNHLFGDEDVKASRVGEECFELVLKKTKK